MGFRDGGNFGGKFHDSSQFFKKDQHLHETVEVIHLHALKLFRANQQALQAGTSEGHERPWHAMAVRFGRLKHISSIRVQPFQPAMLDDRSVTKKFSEIFLS